MRNIRPIARYGLALLLVVYAVQTRPVVAQTQAKAPTQQTFVFVADRKLDSVSVAGTFNNWNKAANPMKVNADGLTWRTTLPMNYGKQLYKFVLNGDTWVLDPRAARVEDDGNGNTNSVLALFPRDYSQPASPNDGVMATSALLHSSREPFLNYDRGKLRLVLRTRPNDLRQVWLRSAGRRIPMRLSRSDELYANYVGEIAWDRKTSLSYDFELVDGKRTTRFGAKGINSQNQPFRLVAKDFHPFVVPTWVEKTVFYQIFPDRFDNGDKSNDPTNVQAWDSAPTGFSRFGGDVAGVKKHVGYLSELGISGVYFNPVFKSPSNHRYDAQDYKTLDPEFGTNAEFSALTKDLQKRGIRTVMDFVFNHTATTFAPFADIREKGEASNYKDWYFIKSYPVKMQDPPNYVAWYNHPAMPKLNLQNPATRDYMLGLVNYWKGQIPLAGMRLDVANEVDMRFWRLLRQRTKSIDPQMWIVGEVWGDGTPWLGGDQWDSVMNYPFLFANADFFADGKTTPTQFTNSLMEIYNRHPPQVSRNMMNMLSSHDTPRFLTRCHNDERLQRLAATVQFTWVGAPSIYYGEEVGMQGGADPDNRRGMRWDLANGGNPMVRFYKRVISLRRFCPALQSGDPKILLADDKNKTLAYARTTDDDVAIVVINRSDSSQTLDIPLPQGPGMKKIREQGFSDGLSKQGFAIGTATHLKITIPPMESAILVSTSSLGGSDAK
ncbi:neopullulanase [Abditibacteriota bacterium]|nr:neopullulanase [Abditibacteriota bacterium]